MSTACPAGVRDSLGEQGDAVADRLFGGLVRAEQFDGAVVSPLDRAVVLDRHQGRVGAGRLAHHTTAPLADSEVRWSGRALEDGERWRKRVDARNRTGGCTVTGQKGKWLQIPEVRYALGSRDAGNLMHLEVCSV